MKPHEEEVKAWLQKAYSDLRSAQILATHGAIVLDTATFHCQQAAEKALKAFLVWRAVPFDRVHNLTYLLDLCEVANADFAELREVTENLTPYAVEIRYPGEKLQLSTKDVEEALVEAKATWDFVLKHLPSELAELETPATEEIEESTEKDEI